jgi:hypothetical protein
MADRRTVSSIKCSSSLEQDVKVGRLTWKASIVIGEIIDQNRDKKVVVFKFKRRGPIRRNVGIGSISRGENRADFGKRRVMAHKKRAAAALRRDCQGRRYG